jgi:CH-like domain in sperm protein
VIGYGILTNLCSALSDAQVIAHYFPKLVELHNYAAANSVSQKMYNWATLNHKVLRRLSYQMSPTEIDAVVQGKPGKLSYLMQSLREIA